MQFLREDSALNYHCRCSVAWRLGIALYTKAGGTPWVLAEVEPGTAFIGIDYALRAGDEAAQRFAICCSQVFDAEGFWDGLGEEKLGETIEIAVDLTDFTDDPRLMAHLNDCVVDPGPPMVARLTYRFQPKANLGRDPESLADYEFIIFGGDDPEMSVGSSLRRMLPLDVQVALRDAEKDLSNWRNSPLRPLIEELGTSLDEDARAEIQEQVNQAQAELVSHDEVVATAERISERLIAIAGEQHAVPLTLGLRIDLWPSTHRA